MARRILGSLSLFILFSLIAVAQTTNFTGTFTITDQPDNSKYFTSLIGVGRVGTLGTALLTLNVNQPLADGGKPGAGQAGAGLTIQFNRADSIVINLAGIPDPSQASITVTGRINTGTGVYATISNPAPSGPTVTLTLTRTSTSPLRYNMSLTGNPVLGGQAISLAIANSQIAVATATPNAFGTSTGSGTLTPFGTTQMSVNVTPGGARTFETAGHLDALATISINQTDSIQFFFTIVGNGPTPETPIVITGGTGKFAGATGTARLSNITEVNSDSTFTLTGSVTQAGPTTPVISSVSTAYFGRKRVTPNAWIEIKGTHLVPANTPAGGTYWSTAPEFAQGKMPTQIGGVSVTFNGKPAYVWWFCSASTTPACATDQINVLGPLNMDAAGDQQVLVVVKDGSDSSAPFPVGKEETNPAVLLFDTLGHAVATHANNSLLGPTTLYPGVSTPGKAGETVTLWTTGFGFTTNSLAEGSATQSGSLPYTPDCFLGGTPAPTAAALVSPGLYILNVTIPNNTSSGDNFFYCTYNNAVLPGVLVAVQ